MTKDQSNQKPIHQFEVKRDMEDVTYGGIFGGEPDMHRRFRPWLTRYFVDGKGVTAQEYLSLAHHSVEERAVEFIQQLVDKGDWHGSAIELTSSGGLDGDELLAHAKAILEDAKRCGNFKP